VARLERALVSFFLDTHTQSNGYTEMAVPFIVGRSTLEGTGQLPKFEHDLFQASGCFGARGGGDNHHCWRHTSDTQTPPLALKLGCRCLVLG